MRLINTTTISLHEFFDDQIPLYVILSHRWEGEEVTFQDLNSGEGRRMKGYAKILGCCRQAREDGFEFAWIDTCCIDKTSSAELSEAINSMFRWYQKAHMCYAYLSDVPAIEDLDHCRENSEFRRSKWFTRGWTLQELLAPEIVVFYNHDWVQIGTKASMDDLISSITNIEVACLAGAPYAEGACVAKKMSWASRRKTTRLEDTAYCLMGLFDINMPLLYGEGKKAFRRLQLEIIKDSSDESIFAWGNACTNRSEVPGLDTTWYYGLLAGDPGDFQGSGDVVAAVSCRPPYSMTNQGLQIQANFIDIREVYGDKAVVRGFEVVFDSVWILTLHCHRQGDESNYLAIYLEKYIDGLSWVRITNWVRSSPFTTADIDAEGSIRWKRQIIIRAWLGYTS